MNLHGGAGGSGREVEDVPVRSNVCVRQPTLLLWKNAQQLGCLFECSFVPVCGETTLIHTM